MSFVLTHTLVNPKDCPVEVWFCPWSFSRVLPAGQDFRFVVTGQHEGELEIVEEAQGIIVYAWPSATMKVFVGDELVADFLTPCAKLPEGMSLRGFFEECGYPDEENVEPDISADQPRE